MSFSLTLASALALANGIIRIGREIDLIAAAKVAREDALSLPIPTATNVTPANVQEFLDFLVEDEDLHDLGTKQDREDIRELVKAENGFSGEELVTAYKRHYAVFALMLRHRWQARLDDPGDARAIVVGNLTSEDQGYIDWVRKHHPAWINEPESMRAVFRLSATGGDSVDRNKETVWRLTKLLLDLLADFGASNAGLITKDAKLQVIVEKVLVSFGDANVHEGNLSAKDVLRVGFSSTLSGVLDARDALDLDNAWLEEFLGAVASLRDELDGDEGIGFDTFVLSLFQGKGYPRLVAVLLETAAGQAGGGAGAGHRAEIKRLSATYLKQVAGLLKSCEDQGQGALRDFVRHRWGDLLRGAFSSINTHADELLGGAGSSLASRVLQSVLHQLSSSPDSAFLRSGSSDLVASLADAAVTAVVENKGLIEAKIDEPWFRELVGHAATVLGNQGLQKTLTADGLASLTREVIHTTARAAALNPSLLDGAVGESWLRQIAPAIVVAITDPGLQSTLDADGLKRVAIAVADAAASVFANDPSLIQDGISETWLSAVVQGAVGGLGTSGVAVLLDKEGATAWIEGVLRSGATALSEDPSMAGTIDESWLRLLVQAVGEAVVATPSGTRLGSDNLREIGVHYFEVVLGHFATNSAEVTAGIGDGRVRAALEALLAAASSDDVVNHFTAEGLRSLIGLTISELADRPEFFLEEDVHRGVAELVGRVTKAVGDSIQSKISAEALASVVLRSALQAVAADPSIIDPDYSRTIAAVATCVAGALDGTPFSEVTVRAVAEAAALDLLENQSLLTSGNGSVAVALLKSTIDAIRETTAGEAEPARIARRIIAPILPELTSAVVRAVAAKGQQLLSGLDQDAARSLIAQSLGPLISATLSGILRRIGDGFSSSDLPVVLETVAGEWASGAVFPADAQALVAKIEERLEILAA
ncbi:hypothetical protein [Haloferula helveola]